MSDEVYDYEADCASDTVSRITEYDRAMLIAHTANERADQALREVGRLLHAAMHARSEAARLIALMDAGEPHDSGTFKESIMYCQNVNRELGGIGGE